MDEHLKWKFISDTVVKRDQWVHLRAGRWLLPNGREIAPYYVYRSRSFIVTVAIGADGNYILVRQFRPGIGDVTTEFPAGAMEDGEDPEEAARRELLEETGASAERWTFLGRIAPNATIAGNYAYIFLAEGCRKTDMQHLDETECMDPVRLSPEELRRMIREGAFVQAVHVAAYYMAEARIREREAPEGSAAPE